MPKIIKLFLLMLNLIFNGINELNRSVMGTPLETATISVWGTLSDDSKIRAK